MIYRRYGRTELKMPVVTCGGMRFQHKWDDCPLDEIPAASQANLAACVHRAVQLGINHIETARGYGSSERQLGQVLPQLPRDEIIVQTKGSPTADPKEFVANFHESLDRLKLDYVDLFSLHGVNNREVLDWSARDGGCLAAARELQKAGKVRHVGFSTHGPPDVVLDAVNCDAYGGFDYVNLHWFYIYQATWPAIAAAARRDMGVFIISPNDKGGMLYKPSDRLCELTAPLHPIVFNDMFSMSHEQVNTLSMGVTEPGNFDLHVQAVDRLGEADSLLPPIVERLQAAMLAAVGPELLDPFNLDLPTWEQTPGEINIPTILWLRNLAVAYDMVEYGKMRYNLLGSGGHWFPGNTAAKLDEIDITPAIAGHPLAARIPDLLQEAHQLLGGDAVKRLSESKS